MKNERRDMVLKLCGSKKEIRVGRHNESEIKIEDLSVSKNHAEIRVVNKQFYVLDKGSMNGTYVNRERIEEGELKEIFDGDKLTFGRYIVDYVVEIEGQKEDREKILERIRNKLDILEIVNQEICGKSDYLKNEEKCIFEELEESVLEKFDVFEEMEEEALRKMKKLDYVERENNILRIEIERFKNKTDNEDLQQMRNCLEEIKKNFGMRFRFLNENKKTISDKLSENIRQAELEYDKIRNREKNCEKKWVNLLEDTEKSKNEIKKLKKLCERMRESSVETEKKNEEEFAFLQKMLDDLDIIKNSENLGNFEKQKEILKISSKIIFTCFKNLEKEIIDNQTSNKELSKILNNQKTELEMKKEKIEKFENRVNEKRQSLEFKNILDEVEILNDYVFELENTSLSFLTQNENCFNFLKNFLKNILKESDVLERYFLNKKNFFEENPNLKGEVLNKILNFKDQANFDISHTQKKFYKENTNIFDEFDENGNFKDFDKDPELSQKSQDLFVKEIILH